MPRVKIKKNKDWNTDKGNISYVNLSQQNFDGRADERFQWDGQMFTPDEKNEDEDTWKIG